MKFLSYLSLFFLAYTLPAQNLVLNPSFENKGLKDSYLPCSHSKDYYEFSEAIEGWCSYAPGTPDLIIKKEEDTACFYPMPRTGNRMVGIITYHPNQDTWFDYDFHEFIQGTLRAPLHVGKTFEIIFYVKYEKEIAINHLKTVYSQETSILSCATNNLGIYFLKNSFTEDANLRKRLYAGKVKPHVFSKEIIDNQSGDWQQIRFTFTADSTYQYFLIGNFSLDKETMTNIPPDILAKIESNNTKEKKFWGRSKRISYYCIDDFTITPLKNKMVEELENNKNYTFQNVNFKSGSAELLPDSYPELENLVTFLVNNPTANIRIEGHTDNVGSQEFNQILSQKRAAALADFLITKNIETQRVTAIGKGETKPVASNNTAEGRRKNRRVQVVIE